MAARRSRMKLVCKKRFLSCWLMALALLPLLPASLLSQGRPNIVWANAGHSESINSVTYSPDGQLLVSGSSDRTIKLWRSNGVFLRSLAIPYDINGQLSDVLAVAVSPDSTLLAAGVEQYNASF